MAKCVFIERGLYFCFVLRSKYRTLYCIRDDSLISNNNVATYLLNILVNFGSTLLENL